MTAAARMIYGSGSFLNFRRRIAVINAMRIVATSVNVRCASTTTAPAIAPIAAAVTPSTNALIEGSFPYFFEVRGRDNSKQITRKECCQGRDHRSPKSGYEISNESNRDHYGTGRDHRHGDCIDKLLFIQPPVFLNHAAVKKRNNSKTTSEDKRPCLCKEPRDFP